MTRKKHSHKPKTVDPIVRIPFCTINSISSTATTYGTPTISSQEVTPGIDFSGRLGQIGDDFAWYRFVSLSVKVYPTSAVFSANNNNEVAVGYLCRLPNTAPTTFAEVMSLNKAVFRSSGMTSPAVMKVNKDILIGDAPLKWFQSTRGTEDPEWEEQGFLYYASYGANPTSFRVVYEGVVEFKGRVNASQNPLFNRIKPAPIPFAQLTEKDTVKSWADESLRKDQAPLPDSSSNDSDQTVTIGGYVYKRL